MTKLFYVNLSEEFGVAGVLPQDSFCLIRVSLLIPCCWIMYKHYIDVAHFAYGASFLCYCSSKVNAPSQPITGNSFHLKQCACLYCKLWLALCDISFLLIGCCDYFFWWYHTQLQYTLLCSQGLAQKMETKKTTIQTGNDNCASLPHYPQEEPLGNSIEFSKENAATEEFCEDETQLGNGQDNFERFSICKESIISQWLYQVHHFTMVISRVFPLCFMVGISEPEEGNWKERWHWFKAEICNRILTSGENDQASSSWH